MKKLSAMLVILVALLSYMKCSSTGTNVTDNTPPSVRLSINELKAEDVKKETAKDVTLKLYNSLKKIKGDKYILYRAIDGINESANRQVIGKISKLGSSYVLTVKVVEGEKSIVLYDRTKMVKSLNDVNKEVENIAGEICKEKKIWQ